MALQEVARRATDPATRAQVEAFEAILRTRYRGRGFREAGSLHAEIADFVMPRIADSGIFQSARYLDILDHVLAEVLPDLDVDEEARQIAALVIEEEAERHRDLQDRITAAAEVG
ncbi:hypothetical protein [Chenggangzhangella methanolivorans]|uniref:Uncharacterized protein n=1 Tax=Chenggangzhangella methanolivorans TaxID=1437009 RepID=A0A9E6UG82_9HYPH|nr:hypothetical protein [Chenggangzhangella methanolivorans]QZN98472.1 hypothetical protein K6K41_15510 [Chenggangzhangella methanolivorans]